MDWRIKIVLVFFSLHSFGFLTAQEEVQEDTTAAKKVIVDHSDLVEGFIENKQEIRYLRGNVKLRQANTFMSCDTAVLFVANNNLTAVGNVLIQQGDTLDVYADSLSYHGNERIADLFGNISMRNKDKILFTDRLTYNLKTKVATYFTGATLISDSTQLTSRRGYYYVQTDEVYFKDTVNVEDPEFSLSCDTLKFNTATNIATFLGPTRILQNEAKIYCESGFYHTDTRDAVLYDNAQYVRADQQATADTIIYDGALKQVVLAGNARFKENDKKAKANRIRYLEESETVYLEGNAIYDSKDQHVESDTIIYYSKTEKYSTSGRATVVDGSQILKAEIIDFDDKIGIGHAKGNVVWVDTAEQITIICEDAKYNKKTNYLKATGGRPMMISMVDNDSLWMTSDTLVSFVENPEEDSLRTMLAYHDVRIFKSDLQAICDSLVYNTADSVFHFYEQPVIWSDTSQFSADTMMIQMANDKIDKIYLFNKSFIINSPDELFFNQIKGKFITAFFKDSELRRMKVEGNSETVYYLRDDAEAYIGVNKSVCSEMMVYFGNNEIDNIRYYDHPTGGLTPMKQADPNAFKLEGFHWKMDKRPRSIEDLY